MTEETTRLALDPGARRRTRSGCKFLLRFGLIICIFIYIWVLFLDASSILGDLSGTRFPHRSRYQNTTLLNSDPGSVVRPLIDAQQTFDIAISVWVRAPKSDEEEYLRRVNADIDEQGTTRTNEHVKVTTPGPMSGVGELLREEVVLETPLYSDIAFRGLRLSDKGIATTINFSLPTARFRDENLTAQDLRASFVLIPSSPSPIDYLKNYSTWLPEFIKLRSRRAWPFPLGSPEQRNRTLVDDALESFSINIPLLEFPFMESRCSNSTTVEKTAESKVLGGHDSDDDEEDAEIGNLDTQGVKVIRPPYVITRTHLRIVDETHLFNRQAYNKAFRMLKKNACGQNSPVYVVDRRVCDRSYRDNGNWETRLQLEIPVPGNEDETEIHWAYAPYMSTLSNAAGSLDIIPVPVNRENSGASSNDTGTSLPMPIEEEFMDITWRVSISGRSPGELLFSDMFTFTSGVDYNASQHRKVQSHNMAELINGIHGHKFHDNAHPRRRVFLMFLTALLKFVRWILGIHYWYTRVSTISISIPGTAFLAVSAIIATVINVVISLKGITSGSSSSFPVLILFMMHIPRPFMMLKIITRAEVVWKSGILVSVHRAAPTHKERASIRLDAQTSWRVKGGLYLSLVAIFYILAPHERLVIPSRLPDPAPDDLSANTKVWDLYRIFCEPLEITGVITQVLLNHRSRTFAGHHRLAVIISLILYTMTLIHYVPTVIGRIDARAGLSVQFVMNVVLWVAMGWQVWTLPNVSQTEEDENME